MKQHAAPGTTWNANGPPACLPKATTTGPSRTPCAPSVLRPTSSKAIACWPIHLLLLQRGSSAAACCAGGRLRRQTTIEVITNAEQPQFERPSIDHLTRFLDGGRIAVRLDPVSAHEFAGSIEPVQSVSRQCEEPPFAVKLTWKWTSWIHLGYTHPSFLIEFAAFFGMWRTRNLG